MRPNVEALEALIEEARQRARRRRRRNATYALSALVLSIGIYAGIIRAVPHDGSVAAAALPNAPASNRAKARNGPITLFVPGGNEPSRIETVGQGQSKVIWQCPGKGFCGQAVSFAWALDGRRVAFSLDEIGGNSGYVGLHVVDVVSGQDAQVPPGAPKTLGVGTTYIKKMIDRVGCWPATELAWSPDGSSLAYRCNKLGTNGVGDQGKPHINVLRLSGSGYETVRTRTLAYWPSWSPDGTRLAYATSLLRPDETSKKDKIYTIALDGSHRRLVAVGGTAPAWSPDGRMIAYQTHCGIRLVTPAGKDVTPTVNSCGAIGDSAPPVWSPDGTRLAFETTSGVYVMNANGTDLHRVSDRATWTWYGALPGRPSWRPVP